MVFVALSGEELDSRWDDVPGGARVGKTCK